MPRISRRGFLATTGATAASIWLAADTDLLRAAGVHATTAEGFAVLSAADAADIEAAAAQIIPTDETPGAREARVIYFIDKSLETFAKDQRAIFRQGARELRNLAFERQPGTKTFAALPGFRQIEILTALEQAKHPFFDALRGATIAGMLANPEYGGNYEKSGWKWIGFDDRFMWSRPFGWYDRDA
jgi:gluconate 2-dehydrogenase gamma chain